MINKRVFEKRPAMTAEEVAAEVLCKILGHDSDGEMGWALNKCKRCRTIYWNPRRGDQAE